jgi:hypothetical protein
MIGKAGLERPSAARRRDVISPDGTVGGTDVGLERGPGRGPRVETERPVLVEGVREGAARPRAQGALVPLGGVREGKPEPNTGNNGDTLDAVDNVADTPGPPHGFRMSLGIEVEAAIGGVEGLAWKPEIRVLDLAWRDETDGLALKDCCAASAIIALRSTLRRFGSQQRRYSTNLNLTSQSKR